VSYKEWKYSDDSISKEWRDERGRLHKEDGPAFISTCKDGTIKREEFWCRGRRHNIAGPAITCYNNDGSIFVEHYYINDVSRYLGSDKEGFWVLWDMLNKREREHPSILKLMLRHT
jgi:hypothetical protein